MKKFGIVILLAVAALGIIAFAPREATASESFLRIHIRADSNSAADQGIKYKVKDEVVKYLTPHLAQCETFEQATAMLNTRLKQIEAVADKVLKTSGFTYTSKASVRREDFPTRTYDGVTLPSGVYDALIINLGSGAGDNWWCVVYPPLCFVNGAENGTADIKYKSKLLEIIENWKNGNKK